MTETQENSSTEQRQKKSKPLVCTVVSDKMEKSRVGAVYRRVKDPLVGKYLNRQTKIMFHDEEGKSKVGDKVKVEQCRPMSARKKFKLVEII
jgi:small subunit ribosomal protein S17